MTPAQNTSLQRSHLACGALSLALQDLQRAICRRRSHVGNAIVEWQYHLGGCVMGETNGYQVVYNIGGRKGPEPGLFLLTGPDYHGPQVPATLRQPTHEP